MDRDEPSPPPDQTDPDGAEDRAARWAVRVLIVEHDPDVAGLWSRFLERQGVVCTHVTDAADAYHALRWESYSAIVLDMELPEGAALEVADFATYRDPEVPIIAVTARRFFSDSAIFDLVPSARGLLATPPPLGDMAAMVEDYAVKQAAPARRASNS